jgi:hypothetical protein
LENFIERVENYKFVLQNLPISEIKFSVCPKFLKQLSLEETEELFEITKECTSLKYLTIKHVKNSQEMRIGNLDLVTPNLEDEELFIECIKRLFKS